MTTLANKGTHAKISVIITFYNIEQYAKTCLDSLALQDYKNCEYICVDDGSTDNTSAILNEFSNDPRFKIVHKQNGGLSDARNYGLDLATGDYITFIDGDDYVHPHYLSILADAVDCQDDVIVISPLKTVKYQKCLDITKGWASTVSYYEITRESIFENILYNKLSVSACGKLAPKSIYDNTRFPIGKVSEEVATIGAILKKSSRFIVIDHPLYGYVMRAGSIGHKKEVPYQEIQDRFDSYKILESEVRNEFDLDKEPELASALQYGWAYRYTTMAMLFENVTNNNDSLQVIKRDVNCWLKNNVKQILKNKKAPFKQRVRILIYAKHPRFYVMIYALFNKFKYNI